MLSDGAGYIITLGHNKGELAVTIIIFCLQAHSPGKRQQSSFETKLNFEFLEPAQLRAL